MFWLLWVILSAATLLYAGFTIFIIIGLSKQKTSDWNTEFPPVAVVLAARNEASTLPKLLEDLRQQDYRGDLQIYIANDRSTDGTGPLLEHFAKQHSNFHALHIRTASTEMTPKKHALTQCIKAAKAEIILATDADSRIGPGWVSSAVKHMDPKTGIVVGYAEIEGQTVFEQYQALDYVGIVVSNAGMMNLGYHWSGSGANLAFRRSAFTRIDGFNPVAHKLSGDDFYLVQTIPLRTGLRARFNYDPAHYVRTHPTPSVKAFLRQRIRWSSNSRGLERQDPLFFSFLVAAYLSNLLLLISIFTLNFTPIFWLALGLKFLAELAVMGVGSSIFKYGRLIWLFPLWFVIQPLYISYVGLMGLLAKIQWK